MKSPEIDPELHGLLDEVVQDPRSALRRTPRRALLEWFGNPTAAHARPIDATTAERHLVAVYRESLAEIFTRTAISLRMQFPKRTHTWKDPQGNAMDVGQILRATRSKAQRALEYGKYRPLVGESVTSSLAACTGELSLERANEFARLAAQLHAGDSAWFAVAFTIPDLRDPESIGILQRVAHCARHAFKRHDSLSQLAVRMSAQGWLHLARQQYETILVEAPAVLEARCYAFNLSLFMGDERAVLEHSELLGNAKTDAAEVAEAACIIKDWASTQDALQVARALKLARKLEDRLSPQAVFLKEALT